MAARASLCDIDTSIIGAGGGHALASSSTLAASSSKNSER
eukprot:CAMPEP_0197559904 /NCGR_PEP_ID=MMETSP1320-20131121/22138_1 /TAXON_ID=91990 /ORGANISM="Bolidomonas sp., Strain RCC2347" /LENGTH=39 /DNA_ID= /DNA_START= /DNA_END= /DNA_ORIENTATION=